MILLVDVGNSRIKWCSRTGRVRANGGQCEHQHRDIAHVTKVAWKGLVTPEGVLVSNVAGLVSGNSDFRSGGATLGCFAQVRGAPS